jgi:hypothetical protein
MSLNDILYPPNIDTSYSATSYLIPITIVNHGLINRSAIGLKISVYDYENKKWSIPYICWVNIQNNFIDIEPIINNYIYTEDAPQGVKLKIQTMGLSRNINCAEFIDYEAFKLWVLDIDNKQSHSIWSEEIEKIIIPNAHIEGDIFISIGGMEINSTIVPQIKELTDVSYQEVSVYSDVERKFLLKSKQSFEETSFEFLSNVIPIHCLEYSFKVTRKYVAVSGFTIVATEVVNWSPAMTTTARMFALRDPEETVEEENFLTQEEDLIIINGGEDEYTISRQNLRTG